MIIISLGVIVLLCDSLNNLEANLEIVGLIINK